MNEQAKIKRIIKFLLLLSSDFGQNVDEIAEKIKISPRTVYRYIDSFRNAGLIIEKNNNGFLKLEKNNSETKCIHDLFQFSEEESYLLQKSIHSLNDDNLIKTNLISKLYSLYNSERVIDTIIKKENSEIISKLSKAILAKKQIRVLNYQSANSNTTTNRVLEPIKFTTNFVSVWCFEPQTKNTKLFKTARINNIEVLSQDWQFETQHKIGFIDCFRISSEEKIPVKLELSLRAKNLLIEEYPLAEKDIAEQPNNFFIFDSFVCNFMGIGRFVMGLADEIKIIEPTELKNHLSEKINKIKF